MYFVSNSKFAFRFNMAGIYIHTPFCKQACNYCNFYFSTSLGNKEKFIRALLCEIDITSSYLEGETIETIYFGGGTPTQLTVSDLAEIIDKLSFVYNLSAVTEFTLEANPDDLQHDSYIRNLKQIGVNRFSIGIQSFFDEDLKYMNRAHNANEALSAVKRVQQAGFSNITIDLIYGTPTMNDERWLQNLETAFELDVPHISSYALTVEPKTGLEQKIRTGKCKPVNEEQSARQFYMLMREMKKNNFEQYEISNFAKKGKYAIHNSSYWKGKKYLGLGPSAHSYNQLSRKWNIANNIAYATALSEGRLNFETEVLTNAQKVNEKIMTGLRTLWGVEISGFDTRTSDLILKNLSEVDSQQYILQNGTLKLTDEGKLFADAIASQLFIEDKDVP